MTFRVVVFPAKRTRRAGSQAGEPFHRESPHDDQEFRFQVRNHGRTWGRHAWSQRHRSRPEQKRAVRESERQDGTKGTQRYLPEPVAPISEPWGPYPCWAALDVQDRDCLGGGSASERHAQAVDQPCASVIGIKIPHRYLEIEQFHGLGNAWDRAYRRVAASLPPAVRKRVRRRAGLSACGPP